MALFFHFSINRLAEKQKLDVLIDFRGILWVFIAMAVTTAFLAPWQFQLQIVVGYVLIAFFYLRILSRYTLKNYINSRFWILNGAGLALGLLVSLFTTHWLFTYLFPVQILLNWLYLGIQYFNVSQYNTTRHEVVMNCRDSLVRLTVYFHLGMLAIMPFGGYLNPLVQYIFLPLMGLVHVWVLFFWDRRLEEKQSHKLTTLEKNLDSMFEFMITIGNAISEKVEMDKVLNYVVKSAVKATGADGGAVFLVDEFEDVLKVKAVEGDFPPPYQVPPKVKLKITTLANYFHSTPIPIGRTIVGECAATGTGIYIRNSQDDPRMAHNSQLDQIYIASIILIPLMQGKKVFGVLAVVSRRGNYLFTQDHFSQIKTFGDYTSLTINNLYVYLQLLEKQEMEREVGIAAEIQGQLLPARLPKVSSIDLAAYSLPAKGVSGDYYDIINIRKGQLLLVVCDVAGKGIPASLVMVMIRTIIHLVAHQPGMTVSKILDIVNWGIAGKVSLDRFATVAMCSYDFYTHTLEYSNAAHHPLLIYRNQDQTFESLDTEGIPIGLEKKTKYNQINTKLDVDDIIVLYTDGIIEAMNEKGEQYSLEALQKVIVQFHDLPPEKLKKKIIDDVGAFVGKAKQHDDQTFLLMKVEN